MAASDKPLRGTALWAVLMPFSILILASLAGASTEPGASTMQDESDPDRILTYEQSTLYMYGISNTESHISWETWNHAEQNDAQSDESFSESNFGVGGNSGGGRREFTFDGTDSNNETIGLDKELPITGKVVLSFFCNGTCTSAQEQIELTLRIGPVDGLTDVSTLNIEPDEVDGNIYTYEFPGHQIDEVEAGDVFGLRIAFNKPSDVPNGGYTLYLGRDNFEMNVPVIPPYEEEVPGLELNEGEDYVSPYSLGTSGFVEESGESNGLGGPIFILFVSIGIVAAIMFFMPPSGIYKVLTVVFVGLGMISAFTIIPVISGPLSMMTAVDENDPDVWTIDELAALQEREGTFLGEMTTGTEFKVYIEYDVVYKAKDINGHGDWHYGLGFESSAETLSDSVESSSRGREYVQLYFSLTNVDLTPGSAVILNVKLVNITTSEGASKVVPQWAVPGEEIYQFWVKDETIGGRWVIPEEDINGDTIVELVGVKYTWQYYPLILSLIGIILAGVGIWQWTRTRRPARRPVRREVEDYDDDFDFDDDDEDFDEDFNDDDFDFDDDDL